MDRKAWFAKQEEEKRKREEAFLREQQNKMRDTLSKIQHLDSTAPWVKRRAQEVGVWEEEINKRKRSRERSLQR